jgi:protein-S-isoprenylcysteine O-methyltransferase Ste14
LFGFVRFALFSGDEPFVMLLLRSIFFTIPQPGTVAILIPYWLISSRGSAVVADHPLRYLGLPLIIIGATGLLWCVWEFFSTGRGTISPLDPPKHLVVRGLYRYVRNPMYVLVVIVLLGEAIFFMSVPVLIETVVFIVLATLFVMLYEEPYLRRRFGEPYERYLETVGRWIPRYR